jgi:hemerythrin superfamily protein
MGAIELLKEEHQLLKKLMDKLEASAYAQEPDLNDLFHRFKDKFTHHDSLEEKAFYWHLKQYPAIQQLILKSYQAHHIVKVGLMELRLLPYASESWAAKFSVVKDSVLTHIEEEETVLFPKVQQLLNKEALEKIDQNVRQMQRAV